ncbi:hypothetical protein NIES2104_64010 [Leptolyngbya sp. NIES-2104]|nr:hypothetical protein NIES2104_64010 [Leptolyngbya sp. NIES-2104]
MLRFNLKAIAPHRRSRKLLTFSLLKLPNQLADSILVVALKRDTSLQRFFQCPAKSFNLSSQHSEFCHFSILLSAV